MNNRNLEVTEKPANNSFDNHPYFKTNGLEKEIDSFKNSKLKDINFHIISKHAIISLLALLLSFFIDLAYVPLLGNITTNIAQYLFPNWQPINRAIQPMSFWWIPVLSYIIFILFAYKAFTELKREVKESTSNEIIDRIIGSSISVIDGIATALPLIGAAILLISIKLGPEVFLGLSVPFEIKALIVLAIGKLFEPVLDEMGVDFQHIINKANEFKNRYYAQAQIDNFQKIITKLEANHIQEIPQNPISLQEMKMFENYISNIAEMSNQIQLNFKNSLELLEKLSKIENISSEKITELEKLSDKIINAAAALKDETTLRSLQSIESIVKK